MAERADPATRSAPLLSQAELEAWGRSVGARAVAEEPVPEVAVPEVAVEEGPGADRSLPLVLALRGALGAGKSVLARAVARGAGVTSPMPSPTYNLSFAYSGRAGVTVHHLDLYRLQDPSDVWELGWDELGEGDQVVLIEWPERAESLLPVPRWDVYLGFGGRDPAIDLFRRVRLVGRGGPPPLPPLPRPREVEGEPDVGA